ncbi:FKBP-type peptidyl-prolyl cis-trans isomerase [Bathycoccus prasinos]|uniref:peptidylprolyl isomerase n=1 Tax=Bathycoccus prasinos TaxID=41875 RepID=K8F319_9CHLO|nr:FKBP-type peptidyl-prolyl cis-trans isomerase [Bathycoccus prasinos]CCO66465.1 FKBP-type peptidyl-prolyl cis-trans isomerase [Bathycoccus prasinos]|eukprot:XP_007510905.1 FKBP-type peptidyl-prolyl cis-trans isomerase [Bathycoccus prasinos]
MIVLNATSKKLLAVILALLIIVLGTFFGETQASKGTTEAGKAFLTENALKEGVVSLPSGLQYRVLKSGPKGGKKPKVNTPCLCHYRGTTIEVRIYDFFAGTARVNRGEEFDSSYNRGEPTKFAPNQVIKGWTEAMQLMSEGDKWELVIPSELAYGDRAMGPQITPGSVLVFEMEIVKVGV